MIQFKDIHVLDNGALFQNVDLHIHSYGASQDVKDKTMTPEAIVDAAVAQGLSVIAITDHNTDKNCAAAVARVATHAGKILVLPGVEVTTAHGHLLVYFSPSRLGELSKFIVRLELIGEPGADNTHTGKSMSDVITIAHAMDAICIAAHIDREKTGFEMFAPGFQNWKKDIITSPGLYGTESDTVKALKWYSELDDSTDEGAARRQLFDGRKNVEALKARHHLAHVQGSDSHSMARFQNPDTSKPWTRMKLTELSFEAVRVALIDPTARVKACGAVPRSIPRIRGIALTGGFLDGETIHFSDNLNCFIGGRGTGKSTAIRALAYGLGKNEPFGEYDNCPDALAVFCEDADGVMYRYDRSRRGDISVRAKEGGEISNVPIDAFRIEYYGQGELADVAKDPLKNPQLFQDFLDRHINLIDLLENEESLVTQLRENAARLLPLESSCGQLVTKRATLADIEKKLKIAEEGKLREVASAQSKITSEKTVRAAVDDIATSYKTGLTLASFERNFDQLLKTAGDCTADEGSKASLQAIRNLLDTTNAALKVKADEINALLAACATELTKHTTEFKANHIRMDGEMAVKLAELKAKGLAGNVAELELLLRQKGTTAREITAIEQKSNDLDQCRAQRKKFLEELVDVRNKMTVRRKAQLTGINENLALTIRDYKIFVKYDDAGIINDFCAFIQEKMTGSYLQDQTIEQVCQKVSPADLAIWVRARDYAQIGAATGLSQDWAEEMVRKLCTWATIFELQVLAKPPSPVITVHTKTYPPKSIPVLQLSDGQRHTILLTIAMLAESNVPLVIDQPEDDLDNAFIFTSIVSTLRAIKEKRQVILVTHNANIAVLGDSELILPMCRENDGGKAKDRGSIDTAATKLCVQNILEGGPAAFLRRKEIYNH